MAKGYTDDAAAAQAWRWRVSAPLLVCGKALDPSKALINQSKILIRLSAPHIVAAENGAGQHENGA